MRSGWSWWGAGIAAFAVDDVAGVAGPGAPSDPEEAQRWDEGTALTLGGQTFKLGILAFDYGITDRINVGTDPPMYLVRTAEPVLIPDLHVKVIAYRWNQLWLTGQAAIYYANLQKGGASGTLWTVPLSAFASYQIDPKWWIHGEVTYNIVWGNGRRRSDADHAGRLGRDAQRAARGDRRISHPADDRDHPARPPAGLHVAPRAQRDGEPRRVHFGRRRRPHQSPRTPTPGRSSPPSPFFGSGSVCRSARVMATTSSPECMSR